MMKKLNKQRVKKIRVEIISLPLIIILCLVASGSYAQMNMNEEMKTILIIPIDAIKIKN